MNKRVKNTILIIVIIIEVLIISLIVLVLMFSEKIDTSKLLVSNRTNESIVLCLAMDSTDIMFSDCLHIQVQLIPDASIKPSYGNLVLADREFLNELLNTKDSSLFLIAYSTDTLKKVLKSNYNNSFNYLADLDPQLNLKAFIEMKNKKKVYYKKLTYKEMNDSDWSFNFDDSMCVWRD